MISVGESPYAVVVQKAPSTQATFETVRNILVYAEPTDFTTPSKQHVLTKDWEDVYELQQTQASPQAVVANIDVFQKNVDKWVTDEFVRTDLTAAVSLYKAAYLQENSLPGND